MVRGSRRQAPRSGEVRRRLARAAIEGLESRLFLSAALRTITGRIFNDVNGNGTRQPKEHFMPDVEVFLDLNSNGVLDTGDLSTVTNKNGTFTFHRLPKGMYDVFEIPPAGDVASGANNGALVVNTTHHSVLNVRFSAKTAPVQGPPADTTPPAGDLVASTLTTSGIAPYHLNVIWTDATAVDASSFNDGNIVVTGPDGYDSPGNLVALDSTANGSPRTTTYQIPAPSDGWNVADDGVYTVTLQGGQIRDTVGNVDPSAVLGTFSVDIPADSPSAPALLGGVNGVTPDNNYSPGTALSFSVSNTMPGAQVELLADGVQVGSATATSENTIIVTTGQSTLADGAHNFICRETLSNNVQADSQPTSVTVDTLSPSTTLGAPALTAAGQATYQFTVTYTDATAVSSGSLGGQDLTVTGPNGFQQTPILIARDSTSDGPSRVATYQLSAPAGTWATANNGTYTVTLLANSATDEVHNACPGGVLGTFTISIGVALSKTPGTPKLSSSSDTGAYNDDNLTDLNNSATSKELHVSVPGTDNGATVTLYVDGAPVASAVATGATTQLTTNGSLTLADGVHLLTAKQTDSGLGQSAASAGLGIIIDTEAPTVSSLPPAVNGSGPTRYTFLVVYHDNISVDVSHLDSTDLMVSNGSGFTQAATFQSVNVPGDGSPRTATYYITPPGGSWTADDNGTYTLSIEGNQVFDTAGNAAPAGTVATFTVNAGIPASPTPNAPVLRGVSDTGVSSSDRLTDLNNASASSTLQFNVGGTVSGATVMLYADGALIGQAVAGGTTTTVTTDGSTLLTDGGHVFTARQIVSGDGQSADSAGTTVTINTSLPSAIALSAANVNTAATSYTFTVTYGDDQGIATGSLDGNDLSIVAPDNSVLSASLVSVSPTSNGTPRVATYQLIPSGGAWDSDDNGAYTISLLPNQVSDTAGNFAVLQTLGQFTVNVLPVSAAPAAPVLAAASDTGISSSDNLTNLNNASPGQALQFSVGNTIAGATVTLYANGFAFGAAIASGTTTIVTSNGNAALANGIQTITARQQVSGDSQSPDSNPLSVAIDASLPAATLLNAKNVTTAASVYNFTVTYGDNAAVALSSLGNGNIAITAPDNSTLGASLVSVSPNANGSPLMATYQLTPPDGSWDPSENGTYTITLLGGQVADTAGNLAAVQTLGQFTVTILPPSAAPAAPVLTAGSDTGVSSSDDLTDLNNSSSSQALHFSVGNTISGATVTLYADGFAFGAAVASGSTTVITTNGSATLPDGVRNITARQQAPGNAQSTDSAPLGITVDTSLPAATLLTAANVTTAASTYTFSVTYADNIAVSAASAGNGNVTVTAPNNSTLTASLVSVSPGTDATPLMATYQLTPPGGAWTSAQNGTYTIKLLAGQIRDTAGNGAAVQTLGNFTVALPAPTVAPATPVLATASDTGSSSSDGLTRLNNSAPGQALQFSVAGTVAGATVTLYADGFAFAAAVASGSTTIVTSDGSSTLSDGAHNITARQQAPGQPQSSDSAGLPIIIDTAPPSAAAALADVTTSGDGTYTFTVTYTDAGGFDPTTLGNGNLLISNGAQFNVAATLVGVDSNSPGSPRTATYQFTPPDGTWDVSSNGIYTVTLPPNQVADAAGNIAPSIGLGSFNVNIPPGG